MLEFWDTDTKGRRDGMKEERKVGRKKEGGEDLSLRSRLIKKVSSGLGLAALECTQRGLLPT